ncbi:MAG: hypothetical protein DRJ33_08530 [Candidatus Methanomethylicota archaeon]|uniref:B box-type domain-containing protein n=1 Tax=Thermoproteota archaeon TaxID=2056631 RepID=A0A497ER85_9CREN|nr:MAG: hypothetical protein DRJ33_08530 [Candidatus Verstraetearchaeota archaeon]
MSKIIIQDWILGSLIEGFKESLYVKLNLRCAKVAKCEICGEKDAVRICSRCHRLICENCTDNIWHVCVDCASVKRAIQEDYLRYLERVNKLVECIEQMSRKADCFRCPLLRDTLMRCLKAVKDLETLGKTEGYEKLAAEAYAVRSKLEDVAIRYLTKLVLSLDKEARK